MKPNKTFEEKEDTSEERIAVLKRVIKEHDKDWKLVQIGLPAENRISVMFQQKHDVVEKN
jgi:cell fate regulator YaaT (PSP1 superfamily)